MFSPQSFLALASHLTMLALLPWLTYRLWSNFRFLRWVRHRASSLPGVQPRMSVLVPARNEAASITPCILSLLGQDYPDFEVLVLDDASTDSTGEQLDQLAAAHARLRVLHRMDDLPPGWNGKSYACHRLAGQATGEWLLFTDADTQHTSQSLALGMAQALALEVDLLSVFPAQRTQTWSERLLVSFVVDFLPLIGFDLRAVWRGDSRPIVTNGQYLLLRAASYRAVGGHAAIGRALLDDFALVGRFRTSGYRIAFVDGTDMLSCRMYQNARQVWEGFSRSLLLGLETASPEKRPVWWPMLFAWGYACLFVMPVYQLLFAPRRGMALLAIGWLGLLRGFTNWRLKRPLLEVFTTPLAAWGVMALVMGTLYRRWRAQKIAWKGRFYRG